MNHQKLYHEVKRQKWCPSARILEGPATYFRERPVGKGIPYAHDNFARCNELATPSCVRTVSGLAPTPQLSKGSWGNTCRIPRASAPGLTNQNVHNSLCERWHFVFLSFCLFVGTKSRMCRWTNLKSVPKLDKKTNGQNANPRQKHKVHFCTSRNWEMQNANLCFTLSGKDKFEICRGFPWQISNLSSIPRQNTTVHLAKSICAKCTFVFCRGFLDKSVEDSSTKTQSALLQIGNSRNAKVQFVFLSRAKPLTNLKSVFWSTLQNALLCFVEDSSTDLSRVKFVFSEICGHRFVWGGGTQIDTAWWDLPFAIDIFPIAIRAFRSFDWD